MGGGPPGFTRGFTCPVLLGKQAEKAEPFRLRGFHSLWRHFPEPSTMDQLCNFSPGLHPRTLAPATPHRQRMEALTPARFRLIPFRSPLLGESRLFFFPQGTEMFQFPWYRPHDLTIGVPGHYPGRVTPFGHPRIYACLTAPRGLTQPATSFIAFWRQGIHRMPLVA